MEGILYVLYYVALNSMKCVSCGIQANPHYRKCSRAVFEGGTSQFYNVLLTCCKLSQLPVSYRAAREKGDLCMNQM